MRRPAVRIPSRPPSFNDLERAKQSYRGTLGLSSLPDSFRYLVIHPERYCLSAASSVNTSRLIPPWKPVSHPAVIASWLESKCQVRPLLRVACLHGHVTRPLCLNGMIVTTEPFAGGCRARGARGRSRRCCGNRRASGHREKVSALRGTGRPRGTW